MQTSLQYMPKMSSFLNNLACKGSHPAPGGGGGGGEDVCFLPFPSHSQLYHQTCLTFGFTLSAEAACPFMSQMRGLCHLLALVIPNLDSWLQELIGQRIKDVHSEKREGLPKKRKQV